MLIRIKYSPEQALEAAKGKGMHPTLAWNVGACIQRMMACQATGGITIDISGGRADKSELYLHSIGFGG